MATTPTPRKREYHLHFCWLGQQQSWKEPACETVEGSPQRTERGAVAGLTPGTESGEIE
jgi:hypothetical protein